MWQYCTIKCSPQGPSSASWLHQLLLGSVSRSDLESLIVSASSDFESVKDCSKPVDRNIICTESGLNHELKKVKTSIDRYLSISQVSMPAIMLSGETIYDGSIKLPRGPKSQLLPSIAHEYGHHVFKSQDLDSRFHQILKEGFSVGLELRQAELFYKSTNEPSALYRPYARRLSRFRAVYTWYCDVMRLDADRDFFLGRSDSDEFERYVLNVSRAPSTHAVGSVLFALSIKNKPKRMVYQDFIRGVFAL